MSEQPIRQHWVPKVYLRAFCAEPKELEQVHARDLVKGINFLSALDRVAVKRHFYTLSPGTPEESFAVEHAFSKIESDVAPVLVAIRESNELPTASEDFAILAQFVATLHLRSRQGLQIIYGHREEVRSRVQQKAAAVNNASQFMDKLIDFDDEEMRELFAKSSIIVGRKIAETLKPMCWRLLLTTSDYFITSENPVYTFHRTAENWGLGTPGAHIIFPLSPSLLIHICNEPIIPGVGTLDVATQTVRGLNGMTLFSAEQFLFSHRPFTDISELISGREPGSNRAFGPK